LRDNNLTAAFLETKSIIKGFKSAAVVTAGITLDFLEIGNEADIYPDRGTKQQPWGPTEYVKESGSSFRS